jgi:hypothetical protein
MRRNITRWVVVLVIAVVIGGAAGCLPTDLPVFLTGWFLRGFVTQSGSDGLTCYRNGEPIDCAEVPSELLPGG